MIALITLIHIAVCLFIVLVVLLQSGTSADIAAAFGGMGSQTAFGPRGTASLLSKATTWSAVIFMLTSITLSIYASRRHGPTSVLGSSKPSTTQSKQLPPNQQKPAPEPQPVNPK